MKIEYEETTKDLQTRIAIHDKYGSRDIDAWMLDLLKPAQGSAILDVACGGGKQLQAFHRFTGGEATLVGVDVSRSLLDQAQALNGSLGNPFTLKEMDFNRDFPFEPASFDLVSCCFAIYYAANAAFTLGQMHRVLRPGGRLFTTGPMPDNKRVFYEIIREASGQPIPPMPGSSRYASEILQAARGLFGNVDVHVFENPLVFEDLPPFLDYTRASLSEDRKLWTGLFSGAEAFETLMGKIAEVAARRLSSDGNCDDEVVGVSAPAREGQRAVFGRKLLFRAHPTISSLGAAPFSNLEKRRKSCVTLSDNQPEPGPEDLVDDTISMALFGIGATRCGWGPSRHATFRAIARRSSSTSSTCTAPTSRTSSSSTPRPTSIRTIRW
jgi:ubiquinone/menaquinone biosynthesis C-methylase UbiE